MLAPRAANTAATPACRWARTRLVSVWYATSRTTSLPNCQTRPSTSSRPVVASSSRSARSNSWSISLANVASAPIEPRWPSTAAFSRIDRWGRSSWSMRAAIRARSEPGRSAPLPQSAASAASSTRNSGLPPPRSTSASTISASCSSRMLDTRHTASSRRRGPSGTRTMSGRSTGGGHTRSGSGRCVVTSRNGRLPSERTTTASRSRSSGSAHCRSSTTTTVSWVPECPLSISSTAVATASRAPAASTRSSGDG